MQSAEVATENSDLLEIPSDVGRNTTFLAAHHGVDQRYQDTYKPVEPIADEVHRAHFLSIEKFVTQDIALNEHRGQRTLQIHCAPL